MSGIYICIADGMADYLPNSQEYHHCEDVDDLRELLRETVENFRAEYPIGEAPYVHWLSVGHLTMIRERGASCLNWRLCIARLEDRVIDVIGMTEEEFEQQANGIEWA